MKKVVILLIAACALFSFSCNKYCNCKHYIDGVEDKDAKTQRYVKESSLDCVNFSTPPEVREDGKTYEQKCK